MYSFSQNMQIDKFFNQGGLVLVIWSKSKQSYLLKQTLFRSLPSRVRSGLSGIHTVSGLECIQPIVIVKNQLLASQNHHHILQNCFVRAR